jgi:TonB-linked SusC/RagA family outer membrane protein
MKKALLLWMVLSLTWEFTLAQERNVTGTVLSAEDGSILPAVSVVVKGTQRGVVTDSKGTFSIQANAKDVLIFSFVGFRSAEVLVGNQSIINLTLETDALLLNELVVTALGISREKKALPFTVQEIKGDKLTVARDPNVVNALAGKIAGVQILSQSGAKFGTPTMRIRGVNALGGSSPLYVVDGTPTSIQFVNMDDVERLSVLKGPAATALYGERAAGGVVEIVTKKAKKGESQVEINHSSTLDMVGLLPKYQNEYGGGYSQEWEHFAFDPTIHPASWKSFDGQNILTYAADESWGPKLDGTPHRSAWSWQPGPEFGQLTPFEASPNNVREFFETPISNNTSVSFGKAGENYSTRLVYTHVANGGIIPNSKQTRDFVTAKSNMTFGKLSADVSLNFSTVVGTNVPADFYGSAGSVLGGYNQTVGSFNQWFQRQVKMDDLRNYKNPDGSFRSWNIGGPEDTHPKYWDSPFTQMYENTNSQRNNRIFGSIGLNYSITKDLTARLTARRDFGQSNLDGRIAAGTLNEGGLGAFATSSGSSLESNYELLLSYAKSNDNVSLNVSGGGNIRQNRSESMYHQTVGGLTTAGFYNIAASKDRPSVSNSLGQRQVRSFFGNASAGYKDKIYVDASIRNDWSSTLPQQHNSYLYGSVGTGIVLSEFLPKNDILTFAKIRGSYAVVGSAAAPYQTNITYVNGSPYGSVPTMKMPTTLPNTNLKPGKSASLEGGFDVRMFHNRVGVEFSVYNQNNTDQIIPLPVSTTSGYSNALINAGLIRTNGLELHINATPIRSKNGFNWELDLNFDRSRSKVVELYPGLTNYEMGYTWRGLTINAREGEDWGLFSGRKIRTLDGKRVVGDDGFYLFDENETLGSVLPKFKGGFQNNFTYKNWSLRTSMDFILGGKFFSVTRMFNAYSGLAAETAGLNELGNPKRDPVANGGGILLDAVTEDGKPNTTRLETQDFYEYYLFGMHDYWVFDQTYVKLREVALGYNFPKKILGKHLSKAAISLFARNPALLYSKIKGGIDISEAESYWEENGQLPPVRSFGVNIQLSF